MRAISSRFILLFLYHLAAEGAGMSLPGCPSRCGDLSVPYPFGVGLNTTCSINPFFAIDCDESSDPPRAFLSVENAEVVSISDAKISIKNSPGMWCYDKQGSPNRKSQFEMDFSGTPFSFSNENKLTVVGCDDAAYLSGDKVDDLFSSCAAICYKQSDLSNGSCSGIGCCQSSIPKGLQYIYVYMNTDQGHHKVNNFSSCGYSFLAETSSYSFNVSDVTDPLFVNRAKETVPIALDWAIGNKTCNELGEGTQTTICQRNSVCVDSDSSLGGYRCSCLQGFEGNPYLSPGAQCGERLSFTIKAIRRAAIRVSFSIF